MNMKHFMYAGCKYILCVFCLVILIGQPIYAGKLDDFEREATEDDDDRQYYVPDDDDDDSFFEALLGGLFRVLFWSDANEGQQQRDPNRIRPEYRERSNEQPAYYEPVLLPSFRLDGGYQNVESDIRAGDLRAELGYHILALQGRFTYYDEEEPADGLWLNYVHGLLRVPLGDGVQLAPGIGAIILAGDNRNSGFSLTAPLLFYWHESFGLEFRPTWSWINENEVNDYDIGVVLGSKHAGLRAGYRWVNSDGESLDGPYLGFLVRF
jgi:hypothetical protein